MKNLENYGVLELNPQEVREVEGGILPLAIVVAWYLLGPMGTHKAY